MRFTVIRSNGTITFRVDSGLVCGCAYNINDDVMYKQTCKYTIMQVITTFIHVNTCIYTCTSTVYMYVDYILYTSFSVRGRKAVFPLSLLFFLSHCLIVMQTLLTPCLICSKPTPHIHVVHAYYDVIVVVMYMYILTARLYNLRTCYISLQKWLTSLPLHTAP